MKIVVFILISFVFYNQSYGQQYQTLISPINNKGSDESNPSLNYNGRILLYDAPMGTFGEQQICVSSQTAGRWSVPLPVSTVNSKSKTLSISGHFLSYDGSEIYFASAQYGGVGGKDIWVSRKKGNTWTPAENLGSPINSKTDETDPAISADGKHLFFTKLSAKKNLLGTPCGQIYYCKRLSKSSWSTPILLPTSVNSGCECNARLAVDGTTLTFASEKKGNKGGYDQYMIKWTAEKILGQAKPIDLVNTEKDDLYISIPAGGDYVYFTANTKLGKDVVRGLLPNDLKPVNTLVMPTKVSLAGSSKTEKVSVLLYQDDKSSLVFPNASDEYILFFNQNYNAEVVYQSNFKLYLPKIQLIKLDTLSRYVEIYQAIKLEQLSASNTYHFARYPLDNEQESKNELNILKRLLKENANRKYTIQYLVSSLESIQDSISLTDISKIKEEMKGDAEKLKSILSENFPQIRINIQPIDKPYVNTNQNSYAKKGFSKVIYLKIEQ